MVIPGSFCPQCRHPLTIIDNIPLASYLLSRGRCRHCGKRISIRYPVVELLTAAIFVVHYTLWGLNPEFFTRTVFFLFVASMAFVDGEFFVIPDELSIGGMVVGLALSFVPGEISPQSAFVGAFFGGGLLLCVAWMGEKLFKKEAMGMGDVKMMAMIGSFVGWQGVIATLFIGSLLGTVVFGPLNIRKRRLIPFGIFLAVGGLLSIYFKDPLVRFYISSFLGQ